LEEFPTHYGKDLETDFAIFRSFFSSAEEVPQKYQMELIKSTL